jgi:diguanylate cyclase (GGDEF)-like protein
MKAMRHDAHFVEELNYASETHAKPLADRITGLFNQPYFELALKREIKRSERHSLCFSVVHIALSNILEIRDNSKDFNLNEFLRLMALKLRKSVREIDLLARLEDDMLGLILPKTERLGAYIITERINGLIGETFDTLNSNPIFNLRLDFGFATYPEDGKEYAQLMAALEESLSQGEAQAGGLPKEAKKRRSDVRLKVKNKIHYLRMDEQGTGSEDFKVAYTKNFSSHGMLLETGEQLPIGLEIVIRYKPFLSRKQEITVVGRVVWSLKKIIDHRETFEVGIMIIPENEAGHRKLRIF